MLLREMKTHRGIHGPGRATLDVQGAGATLTGKGRVSGDAPSVELLTISAAAARVKISRTTLHRLLDAGAIPYVRVFADRRIPAGELQRWIERNTIRAE
jgi:excisionase family DNA binding protein